MVGMRSIGDMRIRELAETLKRTGMVTSETEALRMATHITSTETRQNDNFTTKKDACIMGVANLKIKEARAQSAQQRPETQQIIKSNAEEMIERAKNPKKIEVKTDYDTPSYNQVTEKEQGTIYEKTKIEEAFVEAEEPIVEEEENQPETTKEIFTKPERKDISKFQESKVDISSIFNFNK